MPNEREFRQSPDPATLNTASSLGEGASRSPLAVYLLFWITLGFYGIYWYVRAIGFLNSVDQEDFQSTRKIRAFLFVFLGIYTGGFVFVFIQGSLGNLDPEQPAAAIIFDVLFFMALSWNVLVPVVLMRLAARLRRIQLRFGIDKPASPWRTLLGYVLWFASFPYLQHHLNRLAQMISDT